jgi:hypothetical protein
VYRLNLDPVADEQIKAVPEGALQPLAELNEVGLFSLCPAVTDLGQNLTDGCNLLVN